MPFRGTGPYRYPSAWPGSSDAGDRRPPAPPVIGSQTDPHIAADSSDRIETNILSPQNENRVCLSPFGERAAPEGIADLFARRRLRSTTVSRARLSRDLAELRCSRLHLGKVNLTGPPHPDAIAPALATLLEALPTAGAALGPPAPGRRPRAPSHPRRRRVPSRDCLRPRLRERRVRGRGLPGTRLSVRGRVRGSSSGRGALVVTDTLSLDKVRAVADDLRYLIDTAGAWIRTRPTTAAGAAPPAPSRRPVSRGRPDRARPAATHRASRTEAAQAAVLCFSGRFARDDGAKKLPGAVHEREAIAGQAETGTTARQMRSDPRDV